MGFVQRGILSFQKFSSKACIWPLQAQSRLRVAPGMAESAIQTAEPINIPAHIQVPEDFPSVSIAVDMAADGDIILIAPVEYR